MFEFLIENDTLYLVYRIENLPDFPPIKKKIPIISKDVAIYLFYEWIIKDGEVKQ